MEENPPRCKGTWTAIVYKDEVVNEYLNDDSPRKKRPTIYLWVRDVEGKRKRLVIKGFRPYFFLPGWMDKKSIRFEEVESIEEVEINDNRFLKVYTYRPGQVRHLRRILEKRYEGLTVYEADVLFVLRFLIDSKIRASLEWSRKGIVPLEGDLNIKLRKLFLDIEIWGGRIISPGMMRKREYIKCITVYDSFEKVYHTWYVNKDEIPFQTSREDWRLHYCKNVSEMLTAFLKFVRDTDPDIITGYNIDFDLLNIRQEALRAGLGRELDYLSALHDKGYSVGRPVTKHYRIRGVDWKKKGLRLDGREVVDILDLVRWTSRSQLKEYTLDYVAKEFLGKEEGKLRWKGTTIAPQLIKVWSKEPQVVLEYNLHDVELCVKLDEKLGLIDFLDGLRKEVGVRMEDAFSTQRMIDTECLRRRVTPLPSKFQRKVDYKGGRVLEPKLGLHKWVVLLDYKSLYPSIIRTFNVDTETWIGHPTSESHYVFKDEETGKIFRFRTSPRGLFPKMLDDWVKKRDEIKKTIKNTKDSAQKEILDVRQEVMKVLSNATYGSFAYRSRKNSPDCAAAVTSFGRMLIELASRVAKEIGLEAVYGDTDSIFVKSFAKDYGSAMKEGIRLQQKILERIPRFLRRFGYKEKEHFFFIKVEKVYESILFVSKKRYCGKIRKEDGSTSIDIKGLETKRSDSSEFAQRIQRELLEAILEEARKEKIVRKSRESLNAFDSLPLNEIGVPSAITKPLEDYKVNSIQKKAALFSNRYLGTRFGAGDKPKRIYIVPPSDPEFLEKVDVIAFDEKTKIPSWVKIDYARMMEKTVKPKIEGLLLALGIKWEDIGLKEELIVKKKKRRKRNV